MAKWVSPAEQKRRERLVLVAQVRPAARQAVDALVAGWGATVPSGWSNLLQRAINEAVKAHGITDAHRMYDVAAELSNELQKPVAARWHQQQIEAERAAEALVDTNRPHAVKTRIASSRTRIGELVVVLDSNLDRYGRVLVCIGSEYERGDEDDEGNIPGGWYTDYAEPNEAERATDEYRRLQERIDRKRADDEAFDRAKAERVQRELDAIRAEGREPTSMEIFFAGTSDN